MTNFQYNQKLTTSVIQKFSSEMASRRKKLGYTLKALAEKSNVSDMQLHNMEHGKVKNISLLILFQISTALNYYDWVSGLITPLELHSMTSGIRAFGTRLLLRECDSPIDAKGLKDFKHEDYYETDNNYGVVVSAGPNVKYGYRVGDVLKFNKTMSTKIFFKGDDFLSIDETDVFCQINKQI